MIKEFCIYIKINYVMLRCKRKYQYIKGYFVFIFNLYMGENQLQINQLDIKKEKREIGYNIIYKNIIKVFNYFFVLIFNFK